jgi:hypothetical protein
VTAPTDRAPPPAGSSAPSPTRAGLSRACRAVIIEDNDRIAAGLALDTGLSILVAPIATHDRALNHSGDGRTRPAELKEAVVTGSRSPPAAGVQAFRPVLEISADQLTARGFTTLAEALQQATFATGSAHGPESGGRSSTPASAACAPAARGPGASADDRRGRLPNASLHGGEFAEQCIFGAGVD